MKDKIIIAMASTLVSAGLTTVTMTANWTGRLTAVEQSLTRIEQRLDAIAVRK